MPVFRHDNIDFYYEDDGGTGYPFVFLHGLGGDVKQTMGLFEKENKIRRISLDFRGHGKTVEFGNEKDFSFDTFADDVLALIKYLGLEKVHVGGISTGAGVALNLALRYKKIVSKLVLSRPAWEDKSMGGIAEDSFIELYKSLSGNKSTEEAKKDFVKTEAYKKMAVLSSYAGDSLIGQFSYPYVKKTAFKYLKLPQDAPNYDRNDWKKLDMPVLILACKLDPIHPFEYAELLHSYISNSEFVELTSKTISNNLHSADCKRSIFNFLI